MSARFDYAKAAPEGYRTMLGLESYCRSNVDPVLLHLVKVRASQINGCAYCIDMHWRDARKDGEAEHRLYGLGAWRESPWYSDRERAALAWTEALTLIASTHAPDHDYDEVRRHFSDKELVDLTLAITTINAWNRIAIGFRAEPPASRDRERMAATAATSRA